MRIFGEYLLLVAIMLVGFLFQIAYSLSKAVGLIQPRPDTTFQTRGTFLRASSGCVRCARFYHDTFDSYQEFDAFEARWRTEFVPYASVPYEQSEPDRVVLGLRFGGHTFLGSNLHRCQSCGQLWELSEPDMTWRGYFKPIRWVGDEPTEKLSRQESI